MSTATTEKKGRKPKFSDKEIREIEDVCQQSDLVNGMQGAGILENPEHAVEPGVAKVAVEYAEQQTLFNQVKKAQEDRKGILINAQGGVPNGKGGRIIANAVVLTPDPKTSFNAEKANERFLEVAGVQTVVVLDAPKLAKAIRVSLEQLAKHDQTTAELLQDQMDTLLTYSRSVTEASLEEAVLAKKVSEEDAADAFDITQSVKVTLFKAKA